MHAAKTANSAQVDGDDAGVSSWHPAALLTAGGIGLAGVAGWLAPNLAGLLGGAAVLPAAGAIIVLLVAVVAANQTW